MKITTIQISGFRKILKATINMEDDITVIAGANNSGKTSIVELFNYVFNAKGALCSDDFPVYESQEWCTAVFPYSLKVYIIRKPSSSCLGIECSRYIKTMMDLLKKALSYLTRQRH